MPSGDPREEERTTEDLLPNRIAEFRKEAGLSQHRLAKAVGLKRRSIMAYENRTISPTVETAYKICKVLNKDIKELFLFDANEGDEKDGEMDDFGRGCQGIGQSELRRK